MTDTTLPDRLRDFYSSLDEFKAESFPSRAISPIYNALLSAAKEELPDDATVDAMEQASRFQLKSTTDAGTMRASIKQILAAMGEPVTVHAEPRSGGKTITGDLATKEW